MFQFTGLTGILPHQHCNRDVDQNQRVHSSQGQRGGGQHGTRGGGNHAISEGYLCHNPNTYCFNLDWCFLAQQDKWAT
ncbi:hypothetical protein CHS0354_026070 [Potamilus streckersoni]|uniref:Uncharacterized protein n=1 Tax=Potamilus streckersoni TaxID=2493646 RepID=A0AAE0SG00_9BIVA|nr:hypothetical protein CHS0354_026070 [Potamilus streckersoni]